MIKNLYEERYMKIIKFHYAWIVLFGVIIIRGFAGGGINTVSGLFLKPVSEDLGVGIGKLSIYLSISSVVMLIWLPIAGKLLNKYNAKWLSVLGVILQAGSFIGFGFLNSVWGWYILAVPITMGATILTNLLGPVLINRWFAKNNGLMIGILMGFVGLFAAVLQPLTTYFISSNGWRYAYVSLGSISFIVVLLAALFFIKNYPKDINLKPYGYSEVKTSNNTEKIEGIDISVARKSSSFFLLILFIVAITGFGVFVQHITTYGLQLGYSLDSIGKALSLSAIGTSIGAIAIGILTDKIGAIQTSIGIIIIGTISVILFLISERSFTIFSLAAFLHGLANSSIGVLSPILALKFYGKKDYEKIYSNLMVGAPLASIILIPAYGFIYDLFEGYYFVLIFLLLMMLVSFLSIIFAWKSRCKLMNK